MAIIYTTGTINQPDAATVGLTMAEKIRDDLTAHTAWDLVEEFTAAAGTVRWYIFKCLATESGLPADFFAVMGRTLSNGTLSIAIGEGYNQATKVFSLYALSPGTQTTAYDAQGRAAATFVLGVNGFQNNAGVDPRYFTWAPSGTSTKWWITAVDDGFTVAFNGASNGYIHLGAFVPLTDLPNAMPLQIIGNAYPGGATNGAVTRNPAIAGRSVVNFALSTMIASPNLGFVGDLRYNDRLLSNQRSVAERSIVMNLWPDNTVSAEYGWVMGKQKRMRVGANPPAGFAFGDAYALEGRLWVPYAPTDGQIWDTGMAAA